MTKPRIHPQVAGMNLRCRVECAREVWVLGKLSSPPKLPSSGSLGNSTLVGGELGSCRAHISGSDGDPLVVSIHAGNDDCHAAGTSEAQHVGFLGGRCTLDQPPKRGGGACRGGQVESHIDHSCQLLPKAPHVSAASSMVRVLPIVKDRKAIP